MSMMVSFVLSFFPRDVLDEILNLIESVSEDFPSYSSYQYEFTYLMSKKFFERSRRSRDYEFFLMRTSNGRNPAISGQIKKR